MKPNAARLVIIAIAASLALVASPALAGKDRDYAKGELLVKFKTGHEGKGAKAIEQLGAKVLEKLSRLDVSRLNLPKNLDVDKAMARLKKLPFVEFAEPNYYFKPTWSTSDPRYKDQWGLTKIGTPAAWGIETGNADVIIAIVDTGVDLDHPDLKNKLVPGYDYVDMDSEPDDVGGHGSHCAGIAAASTNNGKGIAGVCANCSVMPLRVLGPSGGLASDVAKGIVWAADHGAQVISMSLGGMFPSSTQQDAIEYAWDKGAILIAAAGNSGVESPHYPAYHSTCVAVGSTEGDDTRSYFSNYGDWVDVAAPGSYIISAVPDGGYEMKSGTSMATPFVAGLAGLIWSELGSGASNEKVRSIIESTTVPVGDWVIKGRIDAAKALKKAKSSAPVAPEPSKDPAPDPGQAKQPDPVAQKDPDPAPPSESGYSPTAYGMDKGSAVKSPQNSLVKSDDTLLVMQSTRSGKKRYLDFNVSSKARLEGKPKGLKVVVEARTYVQPIEVQAYVWNWEKNDWDWALKKTLQLEDGKLVIEKPGAAYVSSGGEMKVRVAAWSDWFSTFEIAADYVRFEPSVQKVKEDPPTSGGGGDDGEDLGKKAKDLFNKLIGG